MRGEIFDSATDRAEFAKSAHKIHAEIVNLEPSAERKANPINVYSAAAALKQANYQSKGVM